MHKDPATDVPIFGKFGAIAAAPIVDPLGLKAAEISVVDVICNSLCSWRRRISILAPLSANTRPFSPPPAERWVQTLQSWTRL